MKTLKTLFVENIQVVSFVNTVVDLKNTTRYLKKLEKKKKMVVNQNNHLIKLIDLVDRCADHVLKYKKYYILNELAEKICDINH